MSLVSNLESKVATLLKPVPHLPAGGQKWIAENVWWIAIISLVASIISVFVAIAGIIAFFAFVPVSYYGYSQVYAGPSVLGLIVSLLVAIVEIGILAMAIKPLRAVNKKGWTLLFVLLLINAASAVVSAVLSLSVFGFIFGIIFGAIGCAIGAYFLFEIHGHFSSKAVKSDKPTEPTFKAEK
jgi:hypothetical protein